MAEMIPNDFRRLLDDCELFVSEILSDENLSEHAEETRQVLLNNFRVVRIRNPQEFPPRLDEDGSDDNRSSSLGRSDGASVASDDQDDGAPDHFADVAPVAPQDLSNVFKKGFLEKKRKDHSFFASEWQKRWCILSGSIFYYFGSEKDKQQKGCFHIYEYSVELVSSLRKDSKKNCCFQFSAPGRRPYQFTASSPQEARDWMDQINFVLRDLSSSSIPYDEEEEEEEEEDYDDIEVVSAADEDIYEMLPDEELNDPSGESNEKTNKSESTDFANYYQCLWDCKADEADELSFNRGDLIYVISKEWNIQGWWVAELNGLVGIVPKDFLQSAFIL
ncbi:src kinase-associated phosphoprotein 1 [Gouania willdenowi]|uniref:src kinase-associated phosphoprotein 1 n=1 Tax=Gouania willdenowi TaxID=441366 RepID=UPI001056D2F7|nr:src kinase-associated phosphoprotein 1 [Gouania willdenowi]